MKVTTLVLNAAGEPHFQSEDQINIEYLFEIAKIREQDARTHGSDWTSGAVTFSAGEVVKAVNTGEHTDVTKAIFEMVMAVWLFDLLYCDITVAHYNESELEFTISAEGAVAYKRVLINP